MKLQEAFMKRNDYRKNIIRLREDLFSVLITDEDQTIDFDATLKKKELREARNNLYRLNCAIDRANQENIETLHMIRQLDEEIQDLIGIRARLVGFRESRTVGYAEEKVIKSVRHLSLIEIDKELKMKEEERRQLDRTLQKKNWQVEVDFKE